MTKKEYLAWKKMRGSPRNWNRSQCIAADAFIKHVTMENFKRILASHDIPAPLREFVYPAVVLHFGSADVDELLMKLGAYPKWM